MARRKLHYQPLKFDRWAWLTVALFALGIVVRVLLYFPLAAYQIDSDGVIAGLCAFRIAEGHYPLFFPGGVRLGAASCYLAAAYFHVVGPGRVGLALTGLTWGILYLAFTLLFLRATLGRRLACLGFVFAVIPTEQFMTVTYPPWAYGEIMASCSATLWLATLWRNQSKPWQRFGFGLSAGLGIWLSLETLMISLPAIIWIALKRHRTLLRELIAALIGVIVGAAPWLVANVGYGFPTLTNNWASQPVSGPGQVLDNLWFLFSNLLPKLLWHWSGWGWESTVFLMGFIVVAAGFVLAPAAKRSEAILIGLVVVATAIIFSLSNAGTFRGWTVRYVAVLYCIVPLFCTIGLAAIWRWSRLVVVATIAALTIPNLWLYGLPGSGVRGELTDELHNDIQLRQTLE
ncbi:MAG: hypothetical protein JO263_07405, partial [Candidatus Eremiobacteraeota bacterium]|nr:hypothetical protein [Candidatus Eremiobacteraeota bacterium]